jgi:hypothetical protein
MIRTHTLLSLLLASAVAVPAVAGAQSRRGGGESGGGEAGGRSGSGESVGTAVPRSPDPAPSSPSQPGVSSPSGAPWPSSGPSARVGRASGQREGGGGPAVRGSSAASASARIANARASLGSAQPRLGPSPRDRDSVVFYGYGYPYSYYQPGYYVGAFSYYNYYDPWFSGFGSWRWGGVGYRSWHDPFLYGGGYYGGPYYWGGGGGVSGRDDADRASTPTGSLRLRANPKTAKVYVDGALAGIVDEFDGLTNHLRLPAGQHQIELRAEGFASQTIEVVIEDGKTRTERISLRPR